LKNALAYYNAGAVAVNLKIEGLAPAKTANQKAFNVEKHTFKL
jgi:hypothetical protein